MTTRDPDNLHDARVDAAWRAASREEPPPALDDAIRAAARREIGAGPRSSAGDASRVPQSLRPERWWWPLAAAATIGVVAIGLLQLVEPEHVAAPAVNKSIVSDAPATAVDKTKKQEATAPDTPAATAPVRQEEAKPVAPASPPRAPTSNVEPAPAAKPAQKLRKNAPAPFPSEERAANVAPPQLAPAEDGAAIAPVAKPFPADKLERESKETTTRDAASASEPSQPVAPARTLRAAPRAQQTQQMQTLAPSAGVAKSDQLAAPRAKVAPKLSVPDWVALIRKLRDEGNADEAAKELAAFRDAYADPDALLPPDLRDWKPPAMR